VRIPIDIEWMTPDAPFGFFVELVPGMGIALGTYVQIFPGSLLKSNGKPIELPFPLGKFLAVNHS